MDFLKLIALQLITPLKLSLVLLALALLFQAISKQRIATLTKRVALFWVLLWSQPYASDVLLHFIEYKPESKSEHAKHSPDYILVLACYYSTQGDVPEISRWAECSLQRNVEAVRLQNKTQAPVIITGGNFLHDSSINYSEVAYDFFTSMNIDKKNLIITKEGTNTYEEILSARRYLENKHVWVVSSATHMYRLERELADIAATTTFFPVDYHSKGSLKPYITLPSQKALENARVALYELLARVKFTYNN
ncbi:MULTISPECIES: YdcF family protein [unclassified Alteromonas]|uniref:YdcF family protein n=1 Tax=unclassified Alteromonas TaxID=2614992 RepID=UPI0005095D1C|nr:MULTISPECIES: YdcF family protein [unclassified Alteromonas]